VNVQSDEEQRPLAAGDLHDPSLFPFVAPRIREVRPRL
jgi:hypothetical protein